jgi:hypothetical protein
MPELDAATSLKSVTLPSSAGSISKLEFVIQIFNPASGFESVPESSHSGLEDRRLSEHQ